MTGFGRGEAPLADGGGAVELRSVNSRYLDLRVRLPRELAALEAPVRAACKPFFSRGQVELQIRPSVDLAQQPGVAVNREAARRYLEAAERLRLEFGLDGGLPLGALFGLPGVVEVREVELGSPELKTAVVAAVEAACREALEMRQREGEALDSDLRERLRLIEELVLEIESRAEEVGQRLLKRLPALAPDLELDAARFDQEVVYYVDRMDVTEETVRLRSHLEQFRAALQQEGPVGRRLEFLLQEMGREGNTIGSKAADAPIASRVVELKTELERVREQVLNVE